MLFFKEIVEYVFTASNSSEEDTVLCHCVCTWSVFINMTIVSWCLPVKFLISVCSVIIQTNGCRYGIQKKDWV